MLKPLNNHIILKKEDTKQNFILTETLHNKAIIIALGPGCCFGLKQNDTVIYNDSGLIQYYQDYIIVEEKDIVAIEEDI